MYNKDLVNVVEMKSGNFGIETPFNSAFKNELKRTIPSATWQNPYWVIESIGLAQAVELLAKYYPTQSALQKVRIEWELNRESPQVDGVELANISRDRWNWRSDCPLSFKVIRQELESGGSRNSPGLYGTLVIEIKVRRGVKISPDAILTVLEDGESPNPLAEFSTEALLAELKRRDSQQS